jgi:alpha-ketoglutaric semialdehyde dehydrogenase
MEASAQEIHFGYIGGEWLPGRNVTTNVNPSNTSDVVGYYARADAEQTQKAIAAATAAFPAWARVSPQLRADALDKIGTEILARKEELGTLLAREEGKTRIEGIGETARAGNIFKFFAGEALRNEGDLVDSVRTGIRVEVTREPVGVVGIITPWNFPIAIPAWKIAPALAFGNCVVFKPADLVPGCGWALAEIIARSGIPGGVFNLAMGSGSVVGEAITTSPEIGAVSFTGSVDRGRAVADRAVKHGARVQLEMGGKNAQVVVDDADLKIAVEVSVQSAFFSTGQRCTAASRFIVTEGIHDRFVAAMVERMIGLKVDDALKQGTDIGPVVDPTQLEDISYIDIARREGAKLAVGGERQKRDSEGYYLSPALFTDSTPKMRINQEEVFGPVASVIRVKNYEEALAVTNDTPFGLTAGIATTSLKISEHFKRNAEVGMVMVNVPTAGVDYHVPFGGRKGSSYGPREQGRYAREFYTVVKTAYVAG